MKWLKYELYQSTLESGEVITAPKEIPWSEANLALANREAYGEVKVDDDGQPESTEPTDAERIKELEEALELLLTGVTE